MLIQYSYELTEASKGEMKVENMEIQEMLLRRLRRHKNILELRSKCA